MANVAVVSFTVIADTDEKAASLARKGLLNHLDKAVATYKRVGGVMDSPVDADKMKAMLEKGADTFVRSPFSFVGSVNSVREKLQELRSVGLSRFITPVGFGLNHQQAWESACALAQDVAPELFGAQRASAASAVMA